MLSSSQHHSLSSSQQPHAPKQPTMIDDDAPKQPKMIDDAPPKQPFSYT
jgi:hypothetical protein